MYIECMFDLLIVCIDGLLMVNDYWFDYVLVMIIENFVLCVMVVSGMLMLMNVVFELYV